MPSPPFREASPVLKGSLLTQGIPHKLHLPQVVGVPATGERRFKIQQSLARG